MVLVSPESFKFNHCSAKNPLKVNRSVSDKRLEVEDQPDDDGNFRDTRKGLRCGLSFALWNNSNVIKKSKIPSKKVSRISFKKNYFVEKKQQQKTRIKKNKKKTKNPKLKNLEQNHIRNVKVAKREELAAELGCRGFCFI